MKYNNGLINMLSKGNPSQTALIAPFKKMKISYEMLQEQIHVMAKKLRKLGICHGDMVISILPNGIEMITSFFAVTSLSAVIAPLNPAYTTEEFHFYIKAIKPKALIIPGDGVTAALKPCLRDTIVIRLELSQSDELLFSTTKALDMSASTNFPYFDDTALFLHTSGTTSKPKGVPLTHGNIIASIQNIINLYNLSQEDVGLCVMPLFHVHGLLTPVLSTLATHGTVIIPPRFSARNFWPTIKEYGVTWYSAVPTIHQILLSRANNDYAPKKSTIRFIRSSSMALPPSVMMAMEGRFGCPVIEGYGMTEASHQISSNPLPPQERKAGTVGFGVGVNIKIMGNDGKFLPPETKGEIAIKGPNVIKGYFKNLDANKKAFIKGWFRTGDLGMMSKNGYLSLLGRLKELINRGGEKISPHEIDYILASHPKISEAISFGMPDPKYGEEVACAVVLKDKLSKEEITRFLETKLAQFKIPKIIYMLDHLPKTATGKIQRNIVARSLIGKNS